MLDWNDLTKSFNYPEPIRDWGLARNQFAILFEDRVPLC
jgi:transposase-like protein